MNRNGVSYGGIALPQPSPELAAEVNRFIDTMAVDEVMRPCWTGLADWRGADFGPTRLVKLGRLYWPTGASRFSLFRTVASEAQLDAIRKKALVSSSQGVLPLPLVIDDGQSIDGSRAVNPPMYMLPSTPFIQWADSDTQKDAAKGVYLVTLVDERYWWWRKAASIKVANGMKWGDFLKSISDALNVTFTFDPIPDAYLNPSSELISAYEYLPLALDAALYSVQRRLLRGLDGTLTLQTPSDAGNSVQDLFEANADRREFGGVYRMDATSTHQELTLSVPKRVRMRFPQQASNPNAIPTYTSFTTTLAGLALDAYANITPKDSDKIVHSDVIASSTNGTALQNLTTEWASDWYLWQPQDMASVYGSIIPWDTEAMSDFVEYDGYGMRTEVRRAPINDLAIKVHHGSIPSTTTSKEFSAAITGVSWTGHNPVFDSTPADNYYLWQYSWVAVAIDGTGGPHLVAITAGANAPYPDSGTAPAGIPLLIADDLGAGDLPATLTFSSAASGGNYVLKMQVSTTTYSATISSSVQDATALQTAINAVLPGGGGGSVLCVPMPGAAAHISSAGGPVTHFGVNSTALTPSSGTNYAVETTGVALRVGTVVTMRKQTDGPTPSVTIVKTATGNGTSTHTAWTVTLANAVGNTFEIDFDSKIDPSQTVVFNAPANSGTGNMQGNLNTYFSPATFTVSGSAGGPYTVTCTSDFKDHNLYADASGLLDNGIYSCTAPVLGPRETVYPGLSGGGTVDIDSRGPHAGGISTALHMIRSDFFGNLSSVPVDGSRLGTVGAVINIDKGGFPFVGVSPWDGTSTHFSGAPTDLLDAVKRLASAYAADHGGSPVP